MTATTQRPPVSAGTRAPELFKGFWQLSLTNWRELYRDPKTLFFSMIFPFMFLAMFSGMGVMMDQAGSTPIVAVTGEGAGSVGTGLADRDITQVTSGQQGTPANVMVTLDGTTALVILDSGETPAKNGVLDAIHAAGISKADITVVGSDGSEIYDPLRGALPAVLMLGLLSLAFIGTAAPLVGLRHRGTLRLLGTTPLSRLTFILAQTPARLALGAVQVALIAAYATYLGYLDLASAGSLMISAIIGLAMLLALGYLLAARISSQELATTVSSLLIPVALIFSGSMLPSQLLPDGLRAVTDKLPTTLLANAFGVDLVGSGNRSELPPAWLLMSAIALVAAVLAAIAFRWDQGERK